MPVQMQYMNLANIYDAAARRQAMQQETQLRGMQMQQLQLQQQRQASLRNVVSQATTPAQPATPFQTDEEQFMGSPSLSGLTAQPATPGSVDYNKIAVGAGQLGDLQGVLGAQKAQQGLTDYQDRSTQQRVATMQKLVDSGDAQAALNYAKTHPDTPQDTQGSFDSKGNFTMVSPSTGIEHTIKPSLAAQHQASYDKWASRAFSRGNNGANTVNAKIAAIRELGLDPEQEASAIQSIVGASVKSGAEKPVRTPTKIDGQTADSLIANHPVLSKLNDTDKTAAANNAAAEFRSLMQNNPKLDQSQAWDKAVNDQAQYVKDVPGRFFGSNTSYVRGGQPSQGGQSDAPTQIKSNDDYRALKSGTKFVDPNGVTRVKP